MQYHHLTIQTHSPEKPKFFIGSALRGSLGPVLKELTCINPSYICKGCFAKDKCLYYEFYEDQIAYRPFRFEVGVANRSYDFGVVLFFNEHRKEELQTIIDALMRMLTQHGVGEKPPVLFPKSTLQLTSLLTNALDQQFTPSSSYKITIHLLTPCILKSAQGHIQKEITVEEILLSIYKRKLFFESHEKHHALPYHPSYKLIEKKFNSDVKTSRVSNRQHKKMVLTGIMGRLEVVDLDPKSYALLKHGEFLGIGNKTALGYGRIKIEISPR